jgi:hypothetical protein
VTRVIDEQSKGFGPLDSSFAPVAKKCRLNRIGGAKEPHVWEVNAGWDVRLDGAAILMTSVTGILLDKGARRPGAFGGLKLRFA